MNGSTSVTHIFLMKWENHVTFTLCIFVSVCMTQGQDYLIMSTRDEHVMLFAMFH